MSKVTQENFPDLKSWREANKLSQSKAAKSLGISQPFYCRLERREQVASGRVAGAIHSKTGVPVDILVGAA